MQQDTSCRVALGPFVLRQRSMHQVLHVFGDIGGTIADALDGTRHE